MIFTLNFYKKFSLETCILFILLIILLALSPFIPKEYSYENHLFENLEVVVLIIGFILSLGKTLFTPLYDSIKFYIAFSIIFLLMAMRELSWGRVFYPIGLWYFDILYPLITILIVIALGLLLYFYYQSTIKGINWNIPLVETIFFIILSILSQCIFDHELIISLAPYNQNLEEFSELFAYIFLICICYKTSFSKHYIRISYFKMF